MTHTAYLYLFFILIASKSTECMMPKSHHTKIPIEPIFIDVSSCVEKFFMPWEIVSTYIMPHLEGLDQIQLKKTCKILDKMITVPEFNTLKLNLEIDPTITTPKLKNLQTMRIINLLEQNHLKIKTICFTNMNQPGFSIFCTMLHVNATLTYINLVNNNMYDDGAQSLANTLIKNSTLTKLNLAFNNIGDNGAQSLANTLIKNTTLTKLDLAFNNIGDDGAQSLANTLTKNSTLTRLDLSFNNINYDTVEAFTNILLKNSILSHLNLKNNNIGHYGGQLLRNSGSKNLTLLL